MAKKTKNWFWKVTGARTLATLELFINLCVVRGVHYGKALEEVMQRHNEEFTKQHGLDGVTLVDEKTLLAKLREANISVTRRTLWKYRNGGTLANESESPAFYTCGRSVIYNLDTCKSFFRKRARGA